MRFEISGVDLRSYQNYVDAIVTCGNPFAAAFGAQADESVQLDDGFAHVIDDSYVTLGSSHACALEAPSGITDGQHGAAVCWGTAGASLDAPEVGIGGRPLGRGRCWPWLAPFTARTCDVESGVQHHLTLGNLCTRSPAGILLSNQRRWCKNVRHHH